MGSDDGWLYCLDPDSGDINWKFKTEGSIQASAIIDGGRAYFGSLDHNFYCIQLPQQDEAPELIWKYDSGAQIISSAHRQGDGLLFCDLDGFIHRIGTDGDPDWVTQLSDMEIWATPLIDESRDLAYVGDVANRMFSVWLSNGSIHQVFVHSLDAEIYSSATLYDGVLYYTTGMEKCLHALDVDSWELVWTFRIDHDTYSTPIVNEQKVYFGSFEYTWCVPAIDPDGDGNITSDEVIWSSPTHDYQGGSSPLAADGKLYIGSDDHNLYCFDLDDGSEIWTFETKGYVYSSPVLHNGSIFVGSSDRSIYSIGDRPPGLSTSIDLDTGEITSDDILIVTVNVTDDDGEPVADADVVFTVSAGYIGFDEIGNTRLVHSTDTNGRILVYYFPIIVSSRSTVTIGVEASYENLRPGRTSIELVVEPGQEVSSSTPDIGGDSGERGLHALFIGLLVLLNLVLASIALIFFIRNRNESQEAQI